MDHRSSPCPRAGQDAPALLAPLGLLVLSGDDRRPPRSAGALIGGGIVGYRPQAVVWYTLHGELIPAEHLGKLGPSSLSRLASILLSTGYEGRLSWTPLVAGAIAGLVLISTGPFPVAERSVATSALAAIAALIFIDVIHPYGQGVAFGARRYLTLTTFLALGAAGLIACLANNDRLLRPGLALLAGPTLAKLWLFTAYELLVLRRGLYGNLATTCGYALGLWSG